MKLIFPKLCKKILIEDRNNNSYLTLNNGKSRKDFLINEFIQDYIKKQLKKIPKKIKNLESKIDFTIIKDIYELDAKTLNITTQIKELSVLEDENIKNQKLLYDQIFMKNKNTLTNENWEKKYDDLLKSDEYPLIQKKIYETMISLQELRIGIIDITYQKNEMKKDLIKKADSFLCI